jgi:hypothetical protein
VPMRVTVRIAVLIAIDLALPVLPAVRLLRQSGRGENDGSENGGGGGNLHGSILCNSARAPAPVTLCYPWTPRSSS